jgi:hypothetical protein
MCRAKNRELLTNKNQVLATWKEHFEEYLNKGSESEQQTRQVDLGMMELTLICRVVRKKKGR